MNERKSLAELPLETFRQTQPEIDESVFESLGVEKAVKAFQSYGSSCPERVQQQVKRWREQLQ